MACYAWMASYGCVILSDRLYKPSARKPWLNGLPRACTSTPWCLAVFVANMGFGRGAHVWLKFSESVNSFGVSVFSPGLWASGFRMAWSNRKINLHSRRLNGTRGRRHGVEILINRDFHEKVKDLGRFRALKRSGVLAGANFIACGAAARLEAGAAAAPE